MTATHPDGIERTNHVDHATLARLLRTLGHENRLKLLGLLRDPRPVSEIVLAPGPGRLGARPSRPIARQSVLEHLKQLQDQGLVEAPPARRDRKALHEYVAVRSRLFGLVETLREVLEGPPPTHVSAQETVAAPGWRKTAPAAAGPRLIVVHGADPGRTYPLSRDQRRGPRGWILGRNTTCHVALDYDPYASGENAEIVPNGSGYMLLDLRTARNGTWLNWNKLPLGEQVPLENGDVIGVGRSLLLFRTS
jgi:DNA-binding transcriptional ArsR family regulator